MSDIQVAVCPEYGPPELVRIQSRPIPVPGEGQVRVRVRAAAVNFPDVLLIGGKYQITVPPPFVPGSEFAGVVEELGPGVDSVAVGDRVTGTGITGAFAEQVVVRVAGLAAIPAGIDDADAAAFGVTYHTAYHCLRSVARVRSGDELIVLGAGGGVGSAAVAIGARLGLSVTAVASAPEKLAVARDSGARHLINYRTDDLRAALRAAVPEGAHAVLDPVGGDLSEPALRSLRRGGRFVTIGYASGTVPRIPLNLVLVKGIQIHGFQFQDLERDEFERGEAELRALLADGTLRPHIGARFPLADTAAALRTVADGRAIGKVVIVMDGPGQH